MSPSSLAGFLFSILFLIGVLALPQVNIMSTSSLDSYWITRGLGTLNKWTYIDATPMKPNELHFAWSILAWLSGLREYNSTTSFTFGNLFGNTVRPAVDGVKMVSGIYSYHTTVDPTVQSNATSLKNFLCDLDWSQPDPYSDIGTLFSANQDFCATDVKFVFVQAISLENATSAILQNSTLLNNKYSNIVAACSQPATAAPHYYYCLFAFVDLEEVLVTNCSRCCSSNACSRR